MAMGADRGILVLSNEEVQPLDVAKILQKVVEAEKAELVIMGKQAIDDDCLQVPQILATMMNLPSVSVVVGMEATATDLVLKREIEGGALEVYGVKLPALVSCNKGLNTPRYASLPGIMKAKKKPLTILSLADVGVSDSDRRVKYSNFQLPPEKPPGKKYDATDAAKMAGVVKDVVGLLRTEAKAI